MKKHLLKLTMMFGLGALMLTNANAQVGSVPGCPGAYGPTKIITGTNKSGSVGSKITTNRTFYKDTVYILKQYVRVASGATLTIQPGTIVMGMPTPADTTILIIERGGKIVANGTSTLPIVFTSCKVQGTRNRGDWGGVVILGNGLNNLGTNVQLEGNYGAFHGGSDNNDNSGSLQFVRIEYAGCAFEPNKESNSLTLGSVGRGTTIRNIQCSYGADDSYEWFGGSVSTRNLISWKTLDDDFDTDNGYSGLNQFGIAFRDPEVADFSGSNGFESDNNDPAADATHTITPKTTATFSHFEVWGPRQNSGTEWNKFFKHGAHLRRGSEQKVYNTIFIGWPGDSTKSETAGIMVDGPQSTTWAVKDSLRSRNNVIGSDATSNNVLSNQAPAAWAPFSGALNWYSNTTFKSQITGMSSIIAQKKAPYNYSNPLFILNNTTTGLGTNSSFQTGGTKPLPVGTYPNGFLSANYRGAFGGTNWAADWTEWHPNLFAYTAGAPTRQAAADLGFDADMLTNMASQVVCSPNPTNAGTTVSFVLANESNATISVLNSTGEVVYNTTGKFNSGVNSISYETLGLETGIYFIQVAAEGSTPKTGKLVVSK